MHKNDPEGDAVMKPVFVAFEGIDGSGKGVQLRALEERLKSEGKKVAVVDFPQYESFFGLEIGKLLSGKYEARADRLDARSMSLWYAMDRWLAFKNNDYSEYDFVLLNRSTLSNAVYQVLRVPESEKEEMLIWIEKLEFDTLEIPRADLFLVFDVPVKKSRENVAKKGHRDYVGEDADVYEKNLSFLEKVRNGYIAAAEKFENAVKINCTDKKGAMRSVDDITEEVYKYVVKL